MSNMQQMWTDEVRADGSAPERMHLKPSLALTGHPRKGCTGGLTNPVFRLAGMLG